MFSITDHTDDSSKAPTSLYQYARNLRTLAERLAAFERVGSDSLSDANAPEINHLMSAFRDGTHPDVKDDGLSNNTLMAYQGNVRKFYRFFGSLPEGDDDRLTVSAGDISMLSPSPSSVDEHDMFTKNDIQAMREAIQHPRDRCLFELLLNTGQRIGAIQTLRVSDIDADAGASGRYLLNPDADGLKGASGKRPLLGARRAVMDWVDMHPSDDPDAYLITHLPSYTRANPGQMLGKDRIRVTLREIAERAGVTKPVNPHNFRHSFVTMCRRDYDMEDYEIIYLLGHTKGSRVIQTTYSHLSAEEINEGVEVKQGFTEPEDKSPLTPPVCPTCSEPVPNAAKACGRCGDVFAPDAVAV